VVLTPIVDEDVWDKQVQLEICRALHKKRLVFSGTINRDGSNTRHDKLRITGIPDDIFLDIISIQSSHTMTMKRIPISDLVSVSITLTDPVDAEEAKTRTLNDVLGIDV
jgi:hypothetical protein